MAEGRVLELTERALPDHELRVAGSDGEHVVRSDQDPIAAEDQAFVAALRGDVAAVRVAYEEALRTHAVVCAADTSARAGVPVPIARTQEAERGG